ncbi:Kinesin-like protein KIF13A [Trichoplax sp. H2]|nr:Kinesin-like protein KIF13A [Trichoplax sp. H2]|eukprot:RDD36883.1 Kinesin-like protein KIF13A [Trichoplax sp. H2]
MDPDQENKFSSQEVVFDSLGIGVLENAFAGYNACIFAYGQTGSGKSYTMMGTDTDRGIIPRLCDRLFEMISQNEKDDYTYKVEVSYMEIYNEKVRDLLNPANHKKPLKVREHKILGPYVENLSKLAVSSFQDIENLMIEGNKSRTVAATNMNAESSRSHAVFNLILTQIICDEATGASGEKVSKVSLVDLAGSERATKTGAAGDRLKEGSNINKSLTTLGLVISALADVEGKREGGKKKPFIPYRDSVLTWLLKDNLGGNSKTVMVATLSPALDNYDETLSTLRYADRAKRIVNHAVVNEDPNAKIIRELREEVERLKSQLRGTGLPGPGSKREMMGNPHEVAGLKEKLAESETLMKEMSLTWEQKLKNTERIHQERQEVLQNLGISVQSSGIALEHGKFYLVNLNADPSLNQLLVYYLKEVTAVGNSNSSDIQLNGLGIQPEHCILNVKEGDVYVKPFPNAKTYVNGKIVNEEMLLYNGDRIVWGNNHFFKLNCTRQRPVGGNNVDLNIVDYHFAQKEVFKEELSVDPVQNVIKEIEQKYHEEKQVKVTDDSKENDNEVQRTENTDVTYDEQRTNNGNILNQDNDGYERAEVYDDENYNEESQRDWDEDSDFAFEQRLMKLQDELLEAKALAREANTLSEELNKGTEFQVTLQIPTASLTPNKERDVLGCEVSIIVRNKRRGTQTWTVEKLANKIFDMRELYEIVNEGQPGKTYQGSDPFYELESHSLIGVANVFLECLHHNVKLDYSAPIISQQGEVVGHLAIEINRIEEPKLRRDRVGNAGDVDEDFLNYYYSKSNHPIEEAQDMESESYDGLCVGDTIQCMIKIKSASGLPSTMSNYVFCQYTFWDKSGTVVPPNNPMQSTAGRTSDVAFNNTQVFTVEVSDDFLDYCSDCSLAIEVWGHRSTGFLSGLSNELADQVEQHKPKTLKEKWYDYIHQAELWVEILEINDDGEYVPVEVLPRSDNLSGGIFQLRQGFARRMFVKVKTVKDSGGLPLAIESIKSVSLGSICSRSKLQKSMDSFQDKDLVRLREKWTAGLMKKREYLDEQIHALIGVKDKSPASALRETSLIDEWVALTEERNAVLVPTPGSGIPGAPPAEDWKPLPGMEDAIPVIFMDLSNDLRTVNNDPEMIDAIGAQCTIFRENRYTNVDLPIIRYEDNGCCTINSWDSSVHDSIYLNRLTPASERVYMILSVVIKLSHPAPLELMLRKRICLKIIKRQGFTLSLFKRFTQTPRHNCGVTYTLVSRIPQHIEDEDEEVDDLTEVTRDEDENADDSSNMLRKYTRGVSNVENILAVDRLRQEVAVKEKLAATGKSLKQTFSSTPNLLRVDSGSSPMVRGSLSRLNYNSQTFTDLQTTRRTSFTQDRSSHAARRIADHAKVNASLSFDNNEEDMVSKHGRSERSKSFGAVDASDAYSKRSPSLHLPGRARNMSALGNLHLPQILSPAPDTSLNSNTNSKGVPMLVQPAPDTLLKSQKFSASSKLSASATSPSGAALSKVASPINNINNNNSNNNNNNNSINTSTGNSNNKFKGSFKRSGLDSLSESYEVLDSDNSDPKTLLNSAKVALLKDGGKGEIDA